MFDLSGRVAVVTGGSSGLGVIFAKALARQGADIALLARREDLMDEVAQEIQALGRNCICVRCDITDTDDIDRAIDKILSHYPRVDILINNAGVVRETAAEDHDDKKWNVVIDTDLSGVFKCSRAFAKRIMIPNKYGRIINISSMAGFIGNNSGSRGVIEPNFSKTVSYHAAKGGVVNLTRALAAEWALHNITVNSIAPGYFAAGFGTTIVPEFQEILDNYCPMKRLGKPAELESAVVYYACDESSFTTGTTLIIDGGWTTI